MPAIDEVLNRRFRLAVIALALLYCGLQVLYVSRLPLVMDEFDGAYEAYRLRRDLPYRDFTPYKTVLGYYIETAGTFAAEDNWGRIMAVKLEIALLNASMLLAAAFYAARFLRRPALVSALLLLVMCSTFLERSSELRVDMLTAWAGLWSMLLLLDERFLWAGIAASLGFLVSQKGAFYVIAALVSLALVQLPRRQWKPMLRFAVGSAVPLAVYGALWSAIASFHAVSTATFVNGAQAALLTGYDIRWRFWKQILTRDPMFFAFSALALWQSWRWRGAETWPRLCTMVYAVLLVIQAVAYTQPWPYFFVLLFPTLFVLQAVFLDAAQERRPDRALGVGWGWVAALTLFAVLYPAHRIGVVLKRSNDYQHYNVELGSALLDPGDTYLAGTDILHDHRQVLPSLSRLGWPVMARLLGPDRAVMPGLVAAIDRRPPKIIIGNYRVYTLPPPFTQYMLAHYARLSASIWSYAPVMSRGRCFVAFDGRYWIDAKASRAVVLDGRTAANGSMVRLKRGWHQLLSEGPARLRLAPEKMEEVLDPRYREEQDFYPHVYDY